MRTWVMELVRASGQRLCRWRRLGRKLWLMGWSGHSGKKELGSSHLMSAHLSEVARFLGSEICLILSWCCVSLLASVLFRGCRTESDYSVCSAGSSPPSQEGLKGLAAFQFLQQMSEYTDSKFSLPQFRIDWPYCCGSGVERLKNKQNTPENKPCDLTPRWQICSDLTPSTGPQLLRSHQFCPTP